MKTLNLTKSNITKDTKIPTEISEKEFWKYYIDFLMSVKGAFLTNTEKNLVVSLLSLDPDVTYFNKNRIDELIELSGYDYGHLFMIKSGLVKKGIIVKASPGKGDYLLAQSLRQFQKVIKNYFKSNNEIEFTFVFKIKDYERDVRDVDTGLF